MLIQTTTNSYAIIAHCQKKLPVSVHAIADAIGLKVWQKSLPDCTGLVMKDETHGGYAGYSIIAHSGDSHVQKRFTIAHEIAHFLLHQDQICGKIEDNRMYQSGMDISEECEANDLANKILLPDRMLDRFKIDKPESLQTIIRVCQIPPQLVRNRLGYSYLQQFEGRNNGRTGY